MSGILTYEFQFNFKNEGSFGLIDSTEAVKFDGASFVVNQEDKRYGRDGYKVNEEIDLFFYKGAWDSVDTPYQLPNGTIVYSLTMGFDYLIQVYNEFGYESEVEFIIKKGGLAFTTGVLDFQTSETDGLTYLSCKIVQSTGKQIIKRRADIVTDIFSTEDLDGNTVTPAITQNILLKAKPVTQESSWGLPSIKSFEVSSSGSASNISKIYNYSNNVLSYGVEDTLSYYNFDDFGQPAGIYEYVTALNDLSDVSLSLNINLSIQRLGTIIENFAFGYVRMRYYIGETIPDNGDGATDIFSIDISNINTATQVATPSGFNYFWYVNETFNIQDLNIPSGKTLWIFFETSYRFGFPSLVITNLNTVDIDIKATSTAIDSVIKGVRYVDVFKENAKRINGSTVDASRFDVGGEYYDQYAFTGNLIKQRDDVPFPVKFKSVMDDLSELNCDYQIIDNKIFIGQYQDFYPNTEIGVFVAPPDDSFKSTFNERYAINELEYKYKNYEQDRQEANTTDAIHTESQWLTSNKQVENTKSIDIELIRDAYKIESSRKLGLKETTSTVDDDKMFVIDVIALSPTTLGGFNTVLLQNIDENGNLQLLRTESFRWDLLGFSVGSVFTILEGAPANIGSYTVIEITEGLVRLEPIGFAPTFTGSVFTKVSYSFNNVSLVNRTNEGLVFFENLIEGDNYSNLRYSIKRNLKTWFPYLATATKFGLAGTLRNTYFKDNGECITRFNDEVDNIEEKANILNVDFGTALLTPFLKMTRLVAPFEDMINVMARIDTITDNTIGGFIRCIDNKGKVIKLYPKDLEYLPSTETLSLTGEERFEGDFLVLTLSGSSITVNQVGYDINTLNNAWFEFDGDYLKIYDTNGLPIINITKYDKVQVNNQIFDTAINLMNYLANN